MVTIILLATAFSGIPDSVNHRAVVRPESAIFEFQVQYDTAWTTGSTEAPVRTPEYEWTESTVVGDTVFSFGYRLYKESYAEADVSDVSARTDAQQPDSTYLRLVLELPIVGTFSYDVLSRERLVNVYREIRDVDVNGCMLSFQVWVQQIAQGAQSRFPRNFFQTTAAIPLDAIDSTALTIRAAHPEGNSKYDPQPWSLHIPVRPDTKSRIMVGNLEHSYKIPTRNIDLVVKNYETAALVKGWLSDGASRCKSWTTSPLKPIR